MSLALLSTFLPVYMVCQKPWCHIALDPIIEHWERRPTPNVKGQEDRGRLEEVYHLRHIKEPLVRTSVPQVLVPFGENAKLTFLLFCCFVKIMYKQKPKIGGGALGGSVGNLCSLGKSTPQRNHRAWTLVY